MNSAEGTREKSGQQGIYIEVDRNFMAQSSCNTFPLILSIFKRSPLFVLFQHQYRSSGLLSRCLQHQMTEVSFYERDAAVVGGVPEKKGKPIFRLHVLLLNER